MIEKIISGGQTGADRAALDWAIAHGVPHGGYCPRGRLAEDGPIDSKYALTETTTVDYAERTGLNILHADGTAIFTVRGLLTGGSKDTLDQARKQGKPFIHLRAKSGNPAADFIYFIDRHDIRILNVAGPRASKEPGIAEFVMKMLDEAKAGGMF